VLKGATDMFSPDGTHLYEISQKPLLAFDKIEKDF